MESMNDPIPEELARRIREALFAGRKIEAIKLHREQTGLGLKESKEAVERLEAELRVASPESFTKSAGAGCLSMMVAVAVVVIWRLAA